MTIDTISSETFDRDGFPDLGFKAAFYFWLKLGFISFGGPAGQIAIMHQELVEKRRWISEERFLHALNFCMMLPGPEAQQLATYLGWLMHKTKGGLAAGLLFILPSFFILLGFSAAYMVWGQMNCIQGVLFGMKPCITAVVITSAYRIGLKTLNHWFFATIAVLGFVGLAIFTLPFPFIIALAAISGLLMSKLQPALFSKGNSEHQSTKEKDDRKTFLDLRAQSENEHFKFSKTKCVKVLIYGLLFWCIPLVLLYFAFGWDHPLSQMAWFFTKASLLTFGGAYSVLPYVYQGAIEGYGWLTPAQMMDGMALGETTPGPLIMVVTFVGFVGGYAKAFLGEGEQILSGAIAALVVTWYTFLPSFVFVFMGAPWVESTRGQLKLTAPLKAITAAVVGVIVNLGLFFALQVLWPNGLQKMPDISSCMILGLALIGLLYFKRNAMEVIGFCAALGLMIQLM
jgi:chromate transporter